MFLVRQPNSDRYEQVKCYPEALLLAGLVARCTVCSQPLDVLNRAVLIYPSANIEREETYYVTSVCLKCAPGSAKNVTDSMRLSA